MYYYAWKRVIQSSRGKNMNSNYVGLIAVTLGMLTVIVAIIELIIAYCKKTKE